MSNRFLAGALVMLWVTLSGCSVTAPSRFYTLNSMPGEMQAAASQAIESGSTTIGIGPVEMPAYLDRPQIVTRIGPNEFKLVEYHRWAEPLKDTLSRVLLENLSYQLREKPVTVLAWQGAMTDVDFQIVVSVSRFDGNTGDKAFLAAQWYILDSESKKRVFTEKTRIEESTKGGDVTALVAALSQTLEKLSIRIADEIRRATD